MKTRLLYVVCLLIAGLMSGSVVNAQSRIGTLSANSTPDEITKYFSDNIMLLDPIEGVYSVQTVNQSWNNYRTFPSKTQNYEMLILKCGDGYYTNIGKETTLIISRIGETNVYDLKTVIEGPDGAFWMSTRTTLENGMTFNYTLDMPVPSDMVGSRATLSSSYIKECPTASMYEDAIKRKLEEQPSEWTGSGFALNNGYLCTNNHVAEGAKSIKIFGVQGDFTTSYSAKVVASDKVNDLAILKIDDVRFPGFGAIPYEVKTTMDEVGVGVFVLGYPLTTTMGNEVKLTTGVISSKTGFQGDVSLYQVSAPIQKGNSGGPLFDIRGNLIGIINAYHAGAENVSYAIKASYLQNLMMSTLSEDILPKNNTISSLSLPDKVAKVKNFVFYIECSSGSATSSNSQSTNTPPTNSGSSNGSGAVGTNADTNGSHTSSVASGAGALAVSNVKIDVRNPYVKKYPRGIRITRIRITDTQTIVDIECDRAKCGYSSVCIQPKTYIWYDKKKHTMIKAEGIPIAPNSHRFYWKNEILSCTLYFPAIPLNTTKFDIIEEPWTKNSWVWRRIELEK